MKRAIKFVLVCLCGLMLFVGCTNQETSTTPTEIATEKIEMNKDSLSDLFEQNSTLFNGIATELYSKVPDGTRFYLENEKVEANNGNGKKIALESLNLTAEKEAELLTCLQTMEQYAKACDANCKVNISVIAFGTDEYEIIDFSLRDTDEWVDYRIIYCEDDIEGTELQDDWYLRIDGLV